MSQPGQWKTQDGRNMQIRDMDDNHLRNSMCYMYRKMIEHEQQVITRQPNTVLPTRDSTEWVNLTGNRYWKTKFCELVNEGARRGTFGPTINSNNAPDFSAALTLVEPWNRELMVRRERWQARQQANLAVTQTGTVTPVALARFNPNLATAPIIRRASDQTHAPNVLSVYVDVAQSAEELVQNPQFNPRPRVEPRVERRFDFDL